MDRDTQILSKIIEEIEYVEDLIEGVGREQFLADETMKRAAAMSTINVGELAKHLSDEFFLEHSDTDLKKASKTRDVYVHGYFKIDFSDAFDTVKNDFPKLKTQINGILSGAVS